MLRFIIISSLSVLLFSCKKNPEKAFLRGQLLDECNGSPVANKTLLLYQNYKPKPNFLQPAVNAFVLETATTDENGNFYFWLDDEHKNKYTGAKYNSSVRFDQSNLVVNGDLGNAKGKESDQSLNYIEDLGVIYNNASFLNFKLTSDTIYNGIAIDSISFSGVQAEYLGIVKNKTNGKFELNFSTNYTQPVYYSLSEPENNGKHEVYIRYRVFANGSQLAFGNTNVYVASCTSQEFVHLEY